MENTQTENTSKEEIKQETAITEEKKEEETPQQIDWRRFKEARRVEREQKEKVERENVEKAKEVEALKAALEAVVNKPTPSTTEEDEIQKRINQAFEERDQKYQKEKEEKDKRELPQRLNQVYSDFNNVCSAENIDYLKFHYPEIASSFNYAPDNFDTWSNIYKTIKRLIPNSSSNQDAKKIESNSKKPQSMSVAGITQTGDSAPQYLDDKRKADNWSRMQKVMRGAK